MARPRVADRGDGLQIWRVAANILKKQSRTADSGWSSSLGVRWGLTTLPHKTKYLLRNTTHSLGPGRIIWLRTGTGGGLLWVRWWTFRVLSHGVSYKWKYKYIYILLINKSECVSVCLCLCVSVCLYVRD
jgi:hypothetical protein